ncbi:hypothetical protein ACTVCO_01305 [Sanguibacter sp. A247]|uniref:hypothetical protein n=1 Tax=unclassified Sanguibacter TaxID=2645534 RepID=UPI003FD7BFD8
MWLFTPTVKLCNNAHEEIGMYRRPKFAAPIGVSAITVICMSALFSATSANAREASPAPGDATEGPALVINGVRGFRGSIEELIAAFPDDDADVTIRVENIEVLDGDARRARDARWVAEQAPLQRSTVGSELACEDRAAAARTRHAVVAMLSCLDQPASTRDKTIDGENVDAVLDALTALIEHAVSTPLAEPLSGALVDGHLTVSVPAAVAQTVSTLDGMKKSSLDDAVYSTLLMVRTVSSATLGVDGDCYAWALTLGGDSCGAMTFDSWEK